MTDEQVFKKIPRRSSLVSHVVDQIVAAIVNGQLGPGDKLVEERVGEQLGVSRGPVREAIRHLESLGLVSKEPYKGTFVSDIDEQEVVEMQAVRAVLEGLAVRLLAGGATAAQLDRLEAPITAMRDVAATGDRRQILVHDADFHDALIAASGNQVLADIWEPLSIKLRRFLYLKRRHTHKTIQDVVEAHERILDAIRTGSADEAEAALQTHLQNVEARFRQSFEEGEGLLQVVTDGQE